MSRTPSPCFRICSAAEIVGRHRRSQNEIRLALAHRIRSSLPLAGFQPAVCNLRKAESLAVEISCLAGVADPEFDVVNAFQLEWIFHPLSLPIPSSHTIARLNPQVP
jgi:hypothetical protein